MAIKDQFGDQKTALSSPLAKGAVGFATGGPLGAALGLLSGTQAGQMGESLSAMQKRAETPNHDQIINDGIAALQHPEIDDHMSTEDQLHTAALLHGAKIFGGDHPAISEIISPREIL